MAGLSIHEVSSGGGRLALCRMPGGEGDYAGDLDTILGWAPALVITMATGSEMKGHGAATLAADLTAKGIGWQHLPVEDFGADSTALQSGWAAAADEALRLLKQGRGVLVHCKGGCGRSGMAVMRLMIEAGEAPEAALARLRALRPCAVETEAQLLWASQPV